MTQEQEGLRELRTLQDVDQLSIAEDRLFHSAQHEEINAGYTTDIYFIKTLEMLQHLGLDQTEVVGEVFSSRPGVLCGTDEVLNMLRGRADEVWALSEGETFEAREVVMRIRGKYGDFGITETPILGILASASGWATSAREVKEAAGGRTTVCFGARHLHPAVAPVMERAAMIGGMDGCSCILGAKLLGRSPVGTVPHVAIIIAGDTLRIAEAYDEIMPSGEPRTILVDTFKDEAEESLRIAAAMGERLSSVRLDTPAERGRVTPGLVREIRARLDQAGHSHVKIFCSGGLDPDTIRSLAEAGADGFGVGSYVSGARPIDMTLDIKEVSGQPIAKRGRIPGITSSPRLKQVW